MTDLKLFYNNTSPIGSFEIWRREPGATLFHQVRSVKNLITNGGKAIFAGLQIALAGVVAPSHAAVGTGTTAAAVTDTALETEVYRAAAIRSRTTLVVLDDTAYYDATINCTASYNITEAGLFNDPSVGILCAHQIFTAVSVSDGVTLKVIWKLQN